MWRQATETLSGYALDHIMVTCREPSAALRACQDLRLTGLPSAEQPGTGASHAVFFFHNAYLEIAWPSSEEPAFEDAPRMNFEERASWRKTGWCPFGIALRLADSSDAPMPPIPSWGYAAPFLPQGAVPIPFGENSDIRA